VSADRRLQYSLHCGRSNKPVVAVIPDRSGLFRIAWPDIAPSDVANLSRCKEAALEWAQHRQATEDRNLLSLGV
jgi:hypothetical protein